MRIALLVTFLLAAVATWPMPIDPFGGLVGHPGNDVWNHVWGYWWVAQEVSEGRFPLLTDLLHFPGTSRLFFIDTFGALVTLPIQWLGGPVLAYNAAVFGGFWLAGLATWALCRHVLERRMPQAGPIAPFVGAAAFALSPHLLAQAYNGISETLTAGTLPLTLLAVLRFLERPALGRALLAGMAGALCMSANAYYGLFAALGAVIFTLTTAASRWEGVNWKSLPWPGAAGLVLAAALVAPLLVLFSGSLDGTDALVNRDPEFVWQSLITHNITDVVSIFRPGRVYLPDLKALHGEDLLIVVYVGWALMALAAYGTAGVARWRDRAPWLVWVAFYGLMMLGPYLHVNGEYLTVADRKVPLPFLAFFDAFPIFARISHPFRFVVPVQLGLAVLATLGAARLGRPALIAALAAVAAESLLFSPGPWPIARSSTETPAYYAEMRNDPTPGAVLDLPIGVPNLERAIYHYWQISHGRPSPYSLNEPIPEVLERSHLARALRLAEAGRLDRLPPMLPDLDFVVAGRMLGALGIRYVVMHDEFYLPNRRRVTRELLEHALGPPSFTSPDGDLVWTLDPQVFAAKAP